MLPTMHLRLTAPNGKVYYLFNRGIQWMALTEQSEATPLSKLSHDPVMFMFALEEAIMQASNGAALVLAAAKAYCPDDFTCNLVANVRKPHRPKPAPDLSLESAGLDIMPACAK